MVVKKDAKAAAIPKVVIEIDDESGIPRYQFSGMWNVREILKIERTLSRKYREYMRLLRNQ
jgi:hypothetical protein